MMSIVNILVLRLRWDKSQPLNFYWLGSEWVGWNSSHCPVSRSFSGLLSRVSELNSISSHSDTQTLHNNKNDANILIWNIFQNNYRLVFWYHSCHQYRQNAKSQNLCIFHVQNFCKSAKRCLLMTNLHMHQSCQGNVQLMTVGMFIESLEDKQSWSCSLYSSVKEFSQLSSVSGKC